MSFTSLTFVVFVATLVIAYYIIPKRFQWVLLLAASYGFYMWGGGKTVFYLILTTCATYIAGRYLGRLNKKDKQISSKENPAAKKRIRRIKRLIVWLSCIFNFGLLFGLKYLPFTVSAAQKVIEGLPTIPNLIIPVGLSFYIFQSMSYVIDCYRGKYEPEKNIAKFALFVSFFPQIIQGPISRFDQLGNQLTAKHCLNWDQLKYGIQLIMWGYFKKLVIAERAAVVVNTVFDSYWTHPGSIMVVGVLGYCVQLYCDFSGGIDITRGVAQMLDINMVENFRRPIFAQSLPEYWRRWHITLGAWMRDYLFYPLALSKAFRRLGRFGRKHFGGVMGKIFATSTATFIVYFVIGIWHGANFRYIAFGFYNGIIITMGLLLEPTFVKIRERIPIKWDGKVWHLIQVFRTASIVFVGRYITRAPRLLSALYMMKCTVLDFQATALTDGSLLNLGITAFDYGVIILGVFVILFIESYQERGVEIRKTLEKKNAFVQFAAIMIPLMTIILLGVVGQNYKGAEFIYAQF